MSETSFYDEKYFYNMAQKIKLLDRLYKEADIIEGLLDLLKTHHRQSYFHTLIVEEIALELAGEFRLPNELLYIISNGAKLHDIGKLDVPAEILNKDNRSELNEGQYQLLREHPVMGAKIIKSFMTEEGKAKLNPIYELVALQHGIGSGYDYPSDEELDNRHELVPFITLADLYAGTRDRGRVHRKPEISLK